MASTGSARLIEWPRDPSADWYRGFLAGIFDAEGSCSGALRIANADITMIGRTVGGPAAPRLLHTWSRAPNQIGVRYVRLLRRAARAATGSSPGSTRPSAANARSTASRSSRPPSSASSRSSRSARRSRCSTSPPGPKTSSPNGVVSHNCFARRTHSYLDMNAGRDFEREIVVKVNVPELVRAEVARPSWKRELVALGTNTDPYRW